MKVYRSQEQSIKYELFRVTKIEFCCDEMSQIVLTGAAKLQHVTPNTLCLQLGSYKLRHCPHCGTKIEIKVNKDKSAP